MEAVVSRRRVLAHLGAGLTIAGLSGCASPGSPVQTVTGPIDAAGLGVTLMHEHIVTDLRAPADRRDGDYDPDDAFQVALPYLTALREAGCRSFVEITPIHIGRDAAVLRRLSEASGLQIIAATGIYGAAEGKFIPDYAHRETAEQLAERYVREAGEGIEGTGVRPGIIKTGVNAMTPLPPIEEKLVRAAALAHKATGLTVASHTGPGAPALAQLDLLTAMDVPLSRFIWVHAQSEQDHEKHFEAARAGAWVEFDGVSEKSIDWHVACIRAMADAGLLNRTLVSHDAGWYSPGEPGGGNYRGYTLLFEQFVPRLRAAGFSDGEIDELLVQNPRAALT